MFSREKAVLLKSRKSRSPGTVSESALLKPSPAFKSIDGTKRSLVSEPAGPFQALRQENPTTETRPIRRRSSAPLRSRDRRGWRLSLPGTGRDTGQTSEWITPPSFSKVEIASLSRRPMPVKTERSALTSTIHVGGRLVLSAPACSRNR